MFPDSKIVKTTVAKGKEPGADAGEVRAVSFELMGVHMVAANAEGDNFTFGQGLSISVDCEDQPMIDSITKKLVDGGGEQQPCGWVKDRFGVSWQIVPAMVAEIMEGDDEAKTDRIIHALYKMKKIDVAELERAANGN